MSFKYSNFLQLENLLENLFSQNPDLFPIAKQIVPFYTMRGTIGTNFVTPLNELHSFFDSMPYGAFFRFIEYMLDKDPFLTPCTMKWDWVKNEFVIVGLRISGEAELDSIMSPLKPNSSLDDGVIALYEGMINQILAQDQESE